MMSDGRLIQVAPTAKLAREYFERRFPELKIVSIKGENALDHYTIFFKDTKEQECCSC